LDPKAPLKEPQRFRFIGKSLPRPDVPAKATGRHKYLHDLVLPGMLHARVIRPPAHGASLKSVDESSTADVAGAKVVRLETVLAVVAEREWDAVRASRQRRAEWTGGTPLGEHATLFDSMRASTVVREQPVTRRGDTSALDAPAPGVRTLTATYRWPVHSHGSIGPSCGVADVRGDRATIWSSSHGTPPSRGAFAKVLGLAPEPVRVIYMDGAGSYGQHGAQDAACDAALLSKAV